MDQREQFGFATQLVIEGRLTDVAKAHYYEAVAAHRTKPSIGAFIPALLAVRVILVSAGVVSTILWPDQRQRRSRRSPLRSELGIEPQHAELLRSREVRDSLMHIDERIETAVQNMATMSQQPPSGMRRFDSNLTLGGVLLDNRGDDGTFIVMGRTPGDGQRIRYIEAANAVLDVGERARNWLANKGVADPFA